MAQVPQVVVDAFRGWAARNGFKVVRSVATVGDVALRCRKGKFSLEIATALAPTQVEVIASGAKHGYSYPMLNKAQPAALAFFAA